MQSRHRFGVATWLATVLAALIFSSVSADEKKKEAKAGEKKSAQADDQGKADEGKKADDGQKANGKKADDGQKQASDAKSDDGGAAGGHGHDPSDLGHGFAGTSLEQPHEFRTDLAIYSFIIFVLLLLILRTFAWGPIMEGLQKREDSIAATIKQAEENAATAEARAREYETRLAEAAEEARALVAEARTDAEAARERILAEADEARQRDRERFLADIEGAKNAAISEVAQQGADIAIVLAGQIVRREIKAGDHAQLIQESLDRFPSNN